MNISIYPIEVSQLKMKNFCYLLLDHDTSDAVLIDPAWEMDKIEAKMLLYGANLKAILITHHHFDHVHLANNFAREYNIAVYISKTEADYYDFSCQNLVEVTVQNAIEIGSINVVPLFTPGHTKGSICYWIANALFTGDTLFAEGCGLCVGRGADPGDMFDSLSFLKIVLPKNTKIYPGHSYGHYPGKDFLFIKQNNIYLSFNEKEKFIDYRMRANQTGLFSFK